MGSIITLSIVQSALELGFIYALVALALFVSFSILDIADLSTDGCFTLGCAVCATVTLAGHPVLGLFAAAAAGVVSGFVTAFLQTRMGIQSILAGIIVNTGLYTINIAVMGFASNINLFSCDCCICSLSRCTQSLVCSGKVVPCFLVFFISFRGCKIFALRLVEFFRFFFR